MNLIGLDLGSTTLSCVVVDTLSRHVIRTITRPAKGAILPGAPGCMCMNPDEMVAQAMALLHEAIAGEPVAAIGLTGQMHGILYTGADGHAVSPLYTWQDQQGLNAMPSGESYVQRLSRETGYPMATGYGLTTHYVLFCLHAVPKQAASLCTIADYLAMRLCALTAPCLHQSMAHSLGLWHMAEHRFDEAALHRAGLSADLLPMTVNDVCMLGRTDEGIPVSAAIGDNQAGFLGSVAEPAGTVLLNIGTSGQLSVMADRLPDACGMELRPLTGTSRLAVGATLCGGKAYQQVAAFVADCARLCGAAVPDDLYDRMNRAAMDWKGTPVTVRPTFSGSRRDPDLLGQIDNIGRDNLTCASLIRGTVDGMLQELYQLYAPLAATLPSMRCLVGSGNAIRKNPLLRQAAQSLFGLQLQLPSSGEEAAFGAALMGGLSCGALGSMSEAQALIRYTRLD